MAEKEIKCDRCNGLLVVEPWPLVGPNIGWLKLNRCVICGDRTDRTIEANRAFMRKRAANPQDFEAAIREAVRRFRSPVRV